MKVCQSGRPSESVRSWTSAPAFDVFTTQHSDNLSAINLELPDGEVLADQMRQQLGVESETLTLREMRELQQEQSQQLRAAQKKLGRRGRRAVSASEHWRAVSSAPSTSGPASRSDSRYSSRSRLAS